MVSNTPEITSPPKKKKSTKSEFQIIVIMKLGKKKIHNFMKTTKKVTKKKENL